MRCLRISIVAALIALPSSFAVAQAPAFGSYKPSSRTYDDFVVTSQYVAMRDGVKLAVDVMLPDGLKSDEKLPALLYLTSFWRNVDVRWPFNHLHSPHPLQLFFVNHGYAVVLVDVRGTGASFGSRLYPWHKDEVDDGGEIVRWVVSQPWSNGSVGAFGLGYEGTTAELLTVPDEPAVKAVMPMFSEFDTYTETAFPGGIFNEWFVRMWSQFNVLMGNNELPKEVGRVARSFARGVSPVAGDKDGARLANALKEHAGNLNLYDLAREATYRDTVFERAGETGSMQDFTVHNHRAKVEASGAAIFAWGSWLDGASADSVIRRFLTYDNPFRGVVGPWNKGGDQNASPYASSDAPTPGAEAQRMEGLRFFDRYLRGQDADAGDRILYYYTMGEEKWKASSVWPPEGFQTRRFFLAPGKSLRTDPPRDGPGSETYRVNMDATTGDDNRWHSHLLGARVVYRDRRADNARLLTYTGPALEEDIEITGHPVVGLYVTSTATDGAFYVYLEDVAPDGRVIYLTEGQLRALHRKVSTDEPPYAMLTPYHSFLEKDGALLVPGERTEMTFGLLPISVRVSRGHRLRVAIAGHDAGTFAPIPERGAPTITVGHDSWIDLPIKARSGE